MGKRQELRQKREQKERQKKLIIFGGILVVAILVSAFIIINANKPIGEIKAAPERSHPQAVGLTMGDPNAPVTVEEFSDFQCVACYRFWENFEEDFIRDYVETGLVYFKYSPFSFIGPESFQAAEAAYCANDQGKFWEYHDMVFNNWAGENLGNFSDQRLIAFAENIDLDTDAFKQCFNRNTYKSQVLQDAAYGQQVGVSGTPSFLVNDTLVYADTLLETIDGYLGK